jgi:hypothetical protein
MQDHDPVSIENYPGLTYKNGYEVDQPLGPLIKLDPYQPDDIYSMKLMSSEGADHHMVYSDKIDHLPDPRHFNINVNDLYVHVVIFMHGAVRQNPFHHYERYLRLVDPVQKYYQTAIDLAWNTLYIESPPNRRIRSLLHEPTLIATKFQRAAMRISQRTQIYRQIRIIIETYIRMHD